LRDEFGRDWRLWVDSIHPRVTRGCTDRRNGTANPRA